MDTTTESFIRNGIFCTTSISHLCNTLLIKALSDSLSSSSVLFLGQSMLGFFVFWTARERNAIKNGD